MLDIIRLISFYLEPEMLSICKDFVGIYDDYWYQQKLILEYPGVKLPQVKYKELYKKSLKTGKLSFISNKPKLICDIDGIKFADLHHDSLRTDFCLSLKFNGDLWVCTYNHSNCMLESYLLDTQVTDISCSSYIKDNICYYLKIDDNMIVNKYAIIKTIEPILSVCTGNSDILISHLVQTYTNLYCYFHKDSQVCTVNFDVSIIKYIKHIGFVIFGILDTWGNLSIFKELHAILDNRARLFNSNNKKLSLNVIKNVQFLYSDGVMLSNKTLLVVQIPYFNINKDNFLMESIFKNSNILLDFVIQDFVIIPKFLSSPDYYFLINNELYQYDIKTKNLATFKQLAGLVPMCKSIKIKSLCDHNMIFKKKILI